MVVPVITVAHTYTHTGISRGKRRRKKRDSGGRRNSFHRAGYFFSFSYSLMQRGVEEEALRVVVGVKASLSFHFDLTKEPRFFFSFIVQLSPCVCVCLLAGRPSPPSPPAGYLRASSMCVLCVCAGSFRLLLGPWSLGVRCPVFSKNIKHPPSIRPGKKRVSIGGSHLWWDDKVLSPLAASLLQLYYYCAYLLFVRITWYQVTHFLFLSLFFHFIFLSPLWQHS